jgi:hypothetical protein
MLKNENISYFTKAGIVYQKDSLYCDDAFISSKDVFVREKLYEMLKKHNLVQNHHLYSFQIILDNNLKIVDIIPNSFKPNPEISKKIMPVFYKFQYAIVKNRKIKTTVVKLLDKNEDANINLDETRSEYIPQVRKLENCHCKYHTMVFTINHNQGDMFPFY